MHYTITSEKITLSYPLFSADFLDAEHLVVGGGGGEGHSGVGNKIVRAPNPPRAAPSQLMHSFRQTLLDVSKSSANTSQTTTQIRELAEHLLSPTEDSCMSLAITRAPSPQGEKLQTIRLLAGINSSEKQQLNGSNEHFRVFNINPQLTSITPHSSLQLFTPAKGTVDAYQRVLRTRGPLAALASGGGKSAFEIVVVSSTDFSVRRRIGIETEVADLDLDLDGNLVYCTNKEIFTVPASAPATADPKKLAWQPTTPLSGTLRSLRLLGRSRIIAVLNAPQRTGSELLIIDAATGSIVIRRKLHKGIRAVTGLDVVELSANNGAIAVAGADQSVEILALENGRIKAVKTFRNVHPFQISKVAFSPAPATRMPAATPAAVAVDEEEEEEEEKAGVIRLATTSIGNTAVVFTLPLIASSKGGYYLLRSSAVAKQTVISVILSLLTVLVFAVVLQVVFVARGGMEGLNELLQPMLKSENLPFLAEVGEAKVVEAQVDALIEGLKSGAVTDPFDQTDVVDGPELREEILGEIRKRLQEAPRDEL